MRSSVPQNRRTGARSRLQQWIVYRAGGRRASAGHPHNATRSIGEDYDPYYLDFSRTHPAVGGYFLDIGGTGWVAYQCLGRIPHWGVAIWGQRGMQD